jgi:prephenate dehydrogenase
VTRFAVIGIGLIGGSAALAFRARAWDRDEDVRAKARGRGIDVAESLEHALDGAELVMAAVSTREAAGVLKWAAARAPRALFTDVASLKRPAAEIAAVLPAGVRYVAGHPMAGGPVPGVQGASATLFAGRPWLLVPTSRSDAASVETLAELVRTIGAIPTVVDAKRHDAVMAWISHLPIAAAAALARVAAREVGADIGAFAGPGLTDTTRLAGTRLPLALELWMSDPPRLAAAVEAVARELSELAGLLRQNDRAVIESFLTEAARARETIVRGS